jgi:hypothetical protein
VDAAARAAIEALLTARLLPVLEQLRAGTGDAKAWQTHFVTPVDSPEVSVVFVLDTNQRLQDASNNGVVDAIAVRTMDVVRDAVPVARFERRDIRFTTQEYCDVVYGGNWYHYFK